MLKEHLRCIIPMPSSEGNMGADSRCEVYCFRLVAAFYGVQRQLAVTVTVTVIEMHYIPTLRSDGSLGTDSRQFIQRLRWVAATRLACRGSSLWPNHYYITIVLLLLYYEMVIVVILLYYDTNMLIC